MNKIIQLLRLSRLVLLVILLLIAVIAKIARADSAVLYRGSYGTPECQAFLSPDPQVVFNVCFPGAERQGWGLHKDPTREYHYVVGPNVNTPYQFVIGELKTCDPKELTNNARPLADDQDYYDSRIAAHPILSKIIYEKAPDGEDAALWFPDRFSRCQNNCVVRYKRYTSEHIGKSTNERDGTSRSTFFRNQTGEVCVPEPKKKNDPPKPPAPDNGDGTDGNGQSNPGSDNGQGQGGNDASGQGSQSGNDSSDNQGSGNSDDSGSSGGGSGSGSGGVNGSGGQTGPSGGGTSGGTDSGSESEGSEGEAGGESDGSGEESSGSGDSGGESGTDSGGQGNVGGDGNNGQDGQPGSTGDGQGNGEGDGQGSISGGSCEANQAPDCKGDPIQCYIAREQWRTACAASGQSNSVETEGNCESNTPPKCKGDAVQCYMAKQQWQQGCAAAAAQSAIGEITEYGKGQQSYLDDLANEGNSDGILDGIQTDTIDLVGKLNTGLVKLPNACPTFPPIDLGVYGKYDIDTNDFCSVLRTLGRIFLAMSYIWAFGIIVRAM